MWIEDCIEDKRAAPQEAKEGTEEKTPEVTKLVLRQVYFATKANQV